MRAMNCLRHDGNVGVVKDAEVREIGVGIRSEVSKMMSTFCKKVGVVG